MQPVLLYTTLPNLSTAREVAGVLLEGHLAACVNILPGMESHYRWEGRREQAEEVVLLAKTTDARETEAIATIRAVHPYDTPCIVTLPITGGLPEFIHWIARETSIPGVRRS